MGSGNIFAPIFAPIQNIIAQFGAEIVIFGDAIAGILIAWQLVAMLLTTTDTLEGRQKRKQHMNHIIIIVIIAVLLSLIITISSNFIKAAAGA